MTVMDAIVASLLAQAVSGDKEAMKLVFDRHQGRAITPIQVTKSETKTFTVNLRRTDPDGSTRELTFDQSALPNPETVIDVTPRSDEQGD